MPKNNLSVHRYKFSDWTPSPIKCIAVDNFSGLVAVGREDGDIEITNPGELWHIQGRIAGKEGFSLKGLAFSPLKSDAGRLFGVSLCGFVFEVDFASLTLKNVRDSYGGAVWSLASNPRETTMALGCEDKTIKLFSYSNNESLEYEKSFPSTGSRVLCVAFNPTLPQVLAGCADGTIRCYDEVTGSSVFRLTGDTVKNTKVSTCIWSLIVLEDSASTIVSGNSKGKLQFWNGKNGDLLNTIHQHSAAVQCLAASEDQCSVFASGVDSRVICVQRIQTSKTQSNQKQPENGTNLPSSNRWVYTNAQRPHSHDVCALAIATPHLAGDSASLMPAPKGNQHSALAAQYKTKSRSVLISGGLDCKMCLYSTADFGGCRPNYLLPVPGSGVASASLAGGKGLVSIKHRTHVDLWGVDVNGVSEGGGCENTCRIQLKTPKESRKRAADTMGRDHIHSVVVSPSGQFVAVTGGCLVPNSSGLRLFHISQDDSGGGMVHRVALDEAVEKATNAEFVSCQAVTFSTSGASMAVAVTAASDVSVLLLDMSSASGEEDGERVVRLHHTLKHSKFTASSGKQALASSESSSGSGSTGVVALLGEAIKSLSFSADDRWLAVASAGRRLFVYEIDRCALHWVLPMFSSPITCVSFHPTSPNSLLTTTTSDSTPFLIYDVQLKDLSVWSKENTDIIPNWKSTIKAQNYGPIESISFDPACESAFMLFGQGFSVYVDLNMPILTSSAPSSDGPDGGSKCQYMNRGQVSVLVDKSSWKDDAPEQPSKKKRRKISNGVEVHVGTGGQSSPHSRNFSVIKAYRSCVLAALLDNKDMLVIENPWVRILENLPATLSRKRFGT